MVKMVRDTTGRFALRPHYEPSDSIRNVSVSFSPSFKRGTEQSSFPFQRMI